jgi:Tol biopolymer transport system component
MRTRIRCLSVVALGTLAGGETALAEGVTTRVSVRTNGVQANGDSDDPGISADGRLVAFQSSASNLFTPDTNGETDIFVHNRDAGRTTVVSLGPGRPADSFSFSPSISPGGRFVAFFSFATDLVAGDTNDAYDVFVNDRQTLATVRASVGPGGLEADNDSRDPAISGGGRFVAFASDAANLVAGDTNGVLDIFLRDLQVATTTRVSVGPGGVEGDGHSVRPSISPNARFVAFASNAANLVAGDTNGFQDIFVRDLQVGTTTRVSIGPGGRQANGDSYAPSISADGRIVAFTSGATNLVRGDTNRALDIFVRDRKAGTTTRVNVAPNGQEANDFSSDSPISANGRFVAFQSRASNLVPGDTNATTDIFVRDRQAGVTTRVSVGPGGTQSDSGSSSPSISADGRSAAFVSSASNLVPGDTNGTPDVFVHTLAP